MILTLAEAELSGLLAAGPYRDSGSELGRSSVTEVLLAAGEQGIYLGSIVFESADGSDGHKGYARLGGGEC